MKEGRQDNKAARKKNQKVVDIKRACQERKCADFRLARSHRDTAPCMADAHKQPGLGQAAHSGPEAPQAHFAAAQPAGT